MERAFNSYGNWNVLTVNGVDEYSTTNSRNELTAFNSSSANQTFNNNGDTLNASSGIIYTYNAWDEMTSATVSGAETVYAYNALGQRIATTNVSAGTTTAQFYSSAGQVIETDVAAATGSTISQYVWGLAYVNDLLVRDDNSTSGTLGGGSTGLGRRLFAITDANFDVTALASTGSTVVQRSDYTPYGVRTVMNSSYVTVTDSYGFYIGFQGGITDPVTGLVHFGARDYDPTTGRWMEPEPYGGAYVDGVNLYQFADSSPVGLVDPSGYATTQPATQPSSLLGTFGDGKSGSMTINNVAGGSNLQIGWNLSPSAYSAWNQDTKASTQLGVFGSSQLNIKFVPNGGNANCAVNDNWYTMVRVVLPKELIRDDPTYVAGIVAHEQSEHGGKNPVVGTGNGKDEGWVGDNTKGDANLPYGFGTPGYNPNDRANFSDTPSVPPYEGAGGRAKETVPPDVYQKKDVNILKEFISIPTLCGKPIGIALVYTLRFNPAHPDDTTLSGAVVRLPK